MLGRWPLHRAVLVTSVLLLALRLTLSLARSGPVIMADEAGYLTNARVLADGMPAEMGSSPFYRGGYSLLVAPFLWLGEDPVLVYHLVLVLNIVLVACLIPVIYLLLTRCLDTSPAAGISAAAAAAAYPSVTAFSQVALPESLLFLLMAVWVLSVGLLLRAKPHVPAVIWAVATGAGAGALWTVHGRMIVVVGLTVVVLLALPACRQMRISASGAGLIALGVGLLAGHLLNDWLLTNNYRGRGSDEAEMLSSSIDIDRVLNVLGNLVGQSWYLLTATLGVALALFACDLPRTVARIRRRRGEPADFLLVVLAATTAGLLVVSAVWFGTRTRPDQLIYGRYVEPIVPVLIAVGLISLARLGQQVRLRVLLPILAGLTVTVAALRLNLDVTAEASRWNVASLPSLTGQLGAPVIVAAGAVGAGAISLLVLIRRRGPCVLAALMLLLFVPTTAYVAYLPVMRSEADVYPSGWTSPRPIVEERRARTVAYDLDRFDHIGVKVYQWFLPETRIVLFHGDTAGSPTPLFISGERLSRKLARRGAIRLWKDPGRNQVLWQIRRAAERMGG